MRMVEVGLVRSRADSSLCSQSIGLTSYGISWMYWYSFREALPFRSTNRKMS